MFLHLKGCIQSRLVNSSHIINRSWRCYSDGPIDLSSILLTKRGKKLKPRDDHFVVLTPRQTGVMKLPRKHKTFQSDSKLSILEGFDIKRHNEKDTKHSVANDVDILSNIQETTNRLMKFKKQDDNEQMAAAIESSKPSSSTISQKRFTQIERVLDEQFTLQQLKNFANLKYGYYKSKITKKKLIPLIINKFWGCTVDINKSEHEDLIVENEIDLETRDIYLLLLTKKGRILQNLARIGATIAVIINENKIVVRATAPIFRYVEVSISKILENVRSTLLSIDQMIKDHSLVDVTNSMHPEEIIALIQSESSGYIEMTEDSEYKISTIGDKNLNVIDRLVVWALNYSPQKNEVIVFCGEDGTRYEQYPLSNYEWIDWISRNKTWYRLQQPINRTQILIEEKPNFDDKLESIENILQKQPENLMVPKLSNKAQTLSVTLGHILQNESKDTLFQTKIPNIYPKMVQLPLWDDIAQADDLYSVDQHIYLVQLKFSPNLASINHKANIAPLELWFTLDDFNSAILESVRCIYHLSENSALLQTPMLSCDYKVSVDCTMDIIPSEYDQSKIMEWIDMKQPGLMAFLNKSKLTFGPKNNSIIPNELVLNMEAEGFDEPQKITYDYATMNYHRVLRFKYMDKYLVQLSEIDGGKLGGITNRVDFVNTTELINKETLRHFIHDISKF